MDFMCDSTFIFTAIYPEAEPLIRHFSLKKRKGALPFEQYASPDEKILLTVTGTGAIAMATAVGAVLGAFGSDGEPQLINWGSCGAEPGTVFGEVGQINREGCDVGEAAVKAEQIDRKSCSAGVGAVTVEEAMEYVFRCCRITDERTGRDFYPDILVRTGLEEAELISGDRIYESGANDFNGLNPKEPVPARDVCVAETQNDLGRSNRQSMPILHDMEGAAFCQAAAVFAGPHRIHVIKAVTDLGDSRKLTRALLKVKMEKAAKRALPEMEKLMKMEGTAAEALDVSDEAAGDRRGCLREKRRLTMAEMKDYSYNCREDSGWRRERIAERTGLAERIELEEGLACSETMKNQLRELLRYASLIEFDVDGWMLEKKKAGLFPCRRKQGKVLLSELRTKLDGTGALMDADNK